MKKYTKKEREAFVKGKIVGNQIAKKKKFKKRFNKKSEYSAKTMKSLHSQYDFTGYDPDSVVIKRYKSHMERKFRNVN